MAKKDEKKNLRAERFWKTWRVPVKGLMKLKFGYSCISEDLPDGAFLVYANHVTDLDPVFVGCSFPRPLTFVAGEAIHRMGLLSRIVRRYANTIDRFKGSTDSACALQILRTLRGGTPVCMFPSGERSYTGKSTDIFPVSAKLAKSARVPLITYRISGGYLTSPRWADTMRRGKMHGEIIRIYTPQELSVLSADELLTSITRDLYEDAYAAEPVRYKGKRLAERLETMLYLCPKCGRADTLKSADNRFSCSCGLSLTMNEYGRFEGDSVPFQHPGEWDDWQQGIMKSIAASAAEKPVFTDIGQQLYKLGQEHELIPVTAGSLSMSGTMISLGSFSLPLQKLDGFAMTQQDKLSFSAAGENYVIRSDHPRCGKKYVDLYRYLKSGPVHS